jgi:histidinol-phosphate aminotransferase
VANPVSARIAALGGYQPGEQPTDRTLVKLNTNENPYPPSPQVEEALRAAAHELNRYPAPMADALRERAARRYGLHRPEQVLVGNGSDELLAICLRACAVEGSRVAYAVPTYSLYRTLAAIAGAVPVEIPAAVPGRAYELPRELFEVDADVKLVCNPNSPFGAPTRLKQIVELARCSRGLVVSDEAYVDFGGETALGAVAECANLIVLRSFSKSFSLAGLRLGLAFGDDGLIAELAKVKDSYNVSRLAIAAGVAALDDYAWMERNVERIVRTRTRVVAAVISAGYAVGESATNFFWMRCGARGGRDSYERLRAQGVLVRWFDAPGLRDGVRVTVGTDEEMDRFLAVLAAG